MSEAYNDSLMLLELENARIRTENARLRERVAVLEGHATDSNGYRAGLEHGAASERAAVVADARSIRFELDSRGADICPNCVTPWKCNGPHIDLDTLRWFADRIAAGEHLPTRAHAGEEGGPSGPRNRTRA